MTNSNFLSKIKMLGIIVAAMSAISVTASDLVIVQQDQTLQKKQFVVEDVFEPLPAGQVKR
jgi:hypothetical protein